MKLSLCLVVLFSSSILLGQNTATLSGTVVDPSYALIPDASIVVVEVRRGIVRQTKTNGEGMYILNSLAPGAYTLEASASGFNTLRLERLTLRPRDRQSLLLELTISPVDPTVVTVVAEVEGVSADPSTGTSVEEEYSRNLPLNARNVNSLAVLTPGVLDVPSGPGGGLNVNGLRSNTNYYTLDGVSADPSAQSAGPGGGGPRGGGGFPGGGGSPGGSVGNLISLDAMEEVRIQTSTFAPEFGRSPGAQISINSRAGTNGYHGSVFGYFRNDRFNANDWFANESGLSRGKMRHNNFGATFGGPIIKNKTYFFGSYEGLRLSQPQTALANVPSLETRAAGAAELQPYLNAFPVPNGPELEDGAARFTSVLSNPSKTDMASLRIDHTLSDELYMFVRYSYTPTEGESRGSGIITPNVISDRNSTSQAFTASLVWTPRAVVTNDLRINFTGSRSNSQSVMDSFGGAVPLTEADVFPEGIDSSNGSFTMMVAGLTGYSVAGFSGGRQAQLNVVDNLTVMRGTHTLKFGADYRRLAPTNYNKSYSSMSTFNGLIDDDGSLLSGISLTSVVSSAEQAVYPLYENFSMYGQDTWKMTDRTTLTYGLRWDVNPAPDVRKGPSPYGLLGSYTVDRLVPLYQTRWFDVAPRIGLAYQIDTTPGRELMFRAGFGFFYDLGYGSTGGAFSGAPYVGQRIITEAEFPLSAEDAEPPALPPTKPYGQLSAADSGLKSPQVTQWNLTVERLFGRSQSLSIGYVGTRGRDLLRVEGQPSFSDDYDLLSLTTNGATSDYHGLQMQFQRRFVSNLQTLISYTWSHSIDSASSDMGGGMGFATLFGSERNDSNFDVRQNLSMSGSYRLPSVKAGFLSPLLRDWWADWVVTVRTGLPFDVGGISSQSNVEEDEEDRPRGLFAQARPDYTGEPVWLDDPNAPGKKRLNPDAFELVDEDEFRQGNLSRNAIRGFGARQIDFSFRREVVVTEAIRIGLVLQAFNVLNTPNFANPSRDEGANMSSPNFGVATRMLNQSGPGGSSQYQVGGPRTMQVSLRFQF